MDPKLLALNAASFYEGGDNVVTYVWLVAGLLATVFLLWGSFAWELWRFRHIPGPTPTFMLGNLLQMRQMQLHRALVHWRQRYGRVYKFFMGRTLNVVFNEPEDVYAICVKHFNNFRDRPPFPFTPFSGKRLKVANEGILMGRGRYWASLRAALQPLFHSKRLATYSTIINQASSRMTDMLAQAAARGEAVDVTVPLGRLTMGVIGRCAFGVDFGSQRPLEEEDTALVKAVRTMFSRSANGGYFALASMALPPSLGPLIAWIYLHITPLLDSELRDTNDARTMMYSTGDVLLTNMRTRRQQQQQQRWEGQGEGQGQLGMDGHDGDDSAGGDGSSGGDVPSDSTPLRRRATWHAPSKASTASREGGGEEEGEEGDAGVAVGETQGGRVHRQASSGAAPLSPRSPLAETEQWQWWQPEYSNHPYKDAQPAPDSMLHMLTSAVNYQTGSGMSDSQIAAQVNTMIAAGYETTAAMLGFALFLLGNAPAALERVLAEVDKHAPQGDISLDDLTLFPYSEAVIKETLRMMPPAIMSPRLAAQDCVVGGTYVPAGTTVVIPIYSLMHDSRFFEAPDEFVPERFLDPKQVARMGHAYCPFGLGPRNCIGVKLAMQEALIALLRLHQRYTFSLDAKHEQHGRTLPVKIGLTMSAKNGVWVIPRERRPKP